MNKNCEFQLICNCNGSLFEYDGEARSFICKKCGETIHEEEAGKHLLSWAE